MADIGGDQAVTLGAKAASAGAAGALWGLFATAFLLIPALIGGILFPFAKKAQGALNNKVQQVNAKEESRPMTKQQREYQRKLEALNAEKEEMELQAKLEALSRKKRQAKGNSSRTSATV
jgi:hypothetical protein